MTTKKYLVKVETKKVYDEHGMLIHCETVPVEIKCDNFGKYTLSDSEEKIYFEFNPNGDYCDDCDPVENPCCPSNRCIGA